MDRRYAVAAAAVALLALVAALMFVYQPPAEFRGPRELPLPAREIYIANLGSNSILGFTIDSNGRVASTPARIIQGPDTGLDNPFDVAVDSSERIYVANMGDPMRARAPSITVYSSGANGNVRPIRVLATFNRGGLPGVFGKVLGLTIRPRPENILVTDQPTNEPRLWGGGGRSRILEFSTTVNPDDLIGMIEGPSTGLDTPAGIALDGSQRIHVAETVRNRILIYLSQPQQFVDLAPVAVIEGPTTSLNNPMDVALGSNGNLYVLNLGSRNPLVQDASVTVYGAGATGNAAPIGSIGGPFAGNANLRDPIGLALDSAGRIFVTQGNSLKVFPAGANGNVSPDQIISDAAINYPAGIAVR